MDRSNSSLSPNEDTFEVAEHPWPRTSCACDQCKKFCRRQPGSLVPGDLDRIAAFLKLSVEEASKYFCASPGSIVKDSSDGQAWRIGTICPKTKGGRCVFLTPDNKCSIHPVSPFGCSHFSAHMNDAVAYPRTVYMTRLQQDPEYQAQRDKLDYARSYKPHVR